MASFETLVSWWFSSLLEEGAHALAAVDAFDFHRSGVPGYSAAVRAETDGSITQTPPEWAFVYECLQAVPPRGLPANEELRQHLVVWLDTNLPSRLAYVLKRHQGLDGVPSETLQAIGNALGVSRERVRQLELKAVRLLRNARRREALRSSLEPTFVQEAERAMCARCAGALEERAATGIKVKATGGVIVALGPFAASQSGSCYICGADVACEVPVRIHIPGVVIAASAGPPNSRETSVEGPPVPHLSVGNKPLRPPRAGSHWTTEEDQRLSSSYENGTDLEHLAAEMGRSSHALLHRLLMLGYVLQRTPEESNKEPLLATELPLRSTALAPAWDQRETLLDPAEYLAWIEGHPPLAIIGVPGSPTARSLARYLQDCGFDRVQVSGDRIHVAGFVVDPHDPTVPFLDEDHPRTVEYQLPRWAQRVLDLEQLPDVFGAPDWLRNATSAYFGFVVLAEACREARPPFLLTPTRFSLTRPTYSEEAPGSDEDMLIGTQRGWLLLEANHEYAYEGHEEDLGDDSDDPAVSGKPESEEVSEFDNEHRFEMDINDMAPEGMSPFDSLG